MLNENLKMKINNILIIFLTFFVTSCSKDKGNYSYKDVNEVIIHPSKFTDTIYNVRIKQDFLKINPELVLTLDKNKSHNYKYEWVCVGQTINKGKRFVIGNEANLNYNVLLPPDEYKLFFRVFDENTQLLFMKETTVVVQSIYSKGWLLAGENNQGIGQMDMISIGRDTIVVKSALNNKSSEPLKPISIVWIDNHEYANDPNLFIACKNGGAFRYTRDNFSGDEKSNLKYSFLSPEFITNCEVTAMQKVPDLRRVSIIDSHVYLLSISFDNTIGFIGNAINYYDANYNYFPVAPEFGYNRTMYRVKVFSFFNLRDKSFCYIRNFGNYLTRLTDSSEDSFSWDTKKDFPPNGLNYIKTINSAFANGQSTTILKHPNNGDYYLYTYKADRSAHILKKNRYKINKANIDLSANYPMVITTKFGYLLFAKKNKLYGLNFRKENPKPILIKEFSNNITTLFLDFYSEQKEDDFLYVATYNDGKKRSGNLFKYQIDNNPNNISITKKYNWNELIKIHDMYYKRY